jgi:uncharacterized protein
MSLLKKQDADAGTLSLVRIIVDTNVLVSGLLNASGNPGLVIELILSKKIDLLLDDRILHEYAEVLYRDRLGLPVEEVATLLDHIARESMRVSAVPLPIVLPDPNDQPFLEVAVAGAADFLITGNMQHFPNIEQAISPKDFILFWRKGQHD